MYKQTGCDRGIHRLKQTVFELRGVSVPSCEVQRKLTKLVPKLYETNDCFHKQKNVVGD